MHSVHKALSACCSVSLPVSTSNRTLTYRFVHSHGHLGNSPETLGPAWPKLEGFGAQPRSVRSTQS